MGFRPLACCGFNLILTAFANTLIRMHHDADFDKANMGNISGSFVGEYFGFCEGEAGAGVVMLIQLTMTQERMQPWLMVHQIGGSNVKLNLESFV